MGKIRILVFFVLSILVVSCTDSSTDKPVNEGDTLMTDSLKGDLSKDTIIIQEDNEGEFKLSAEDKQLLDLMTKINLGFTFFKVKEQYKAVKGIRPEEKRDDLATAGLTESVCKQSIFGGEASAEFNFKNDSLYYYFFTFNEKDSERSEQIFEAIKEYYSEKLGPVQQEMIEEENHYNQNFIWPAAGKSEVSFLNYNLNTNTISWGKKIERLL